MSKLKSVLFEEESALEKLEKEQVEVIGDTIDESLRLAARHFGKEIYQLDYEVLERGKKSLFFSQPFRIRVFIANHEDNIHELEGLDKKLTGGSGKLLSKELKNLIVPKDVDGWVSIKYYRHGLYMMEMPPIGNGKPANSQDVLKRLAMRGIALPSEAAVQKFLATKSTEYVRMGEAKLKPFAEAGAKVEVSDDNMKAFITLLPPKPGGRDLEVQDVIYELKKEDIVYGIKEDVIREALLAEKYNEPFVAAAGDPPLHGKNAQIVYHVRTEKKVVLKEDANGKVDYKDLDLIENVVVGQLLAEKTPPEKGKYGRDLFNQMLEAKDGQDVPLNQGKGTILSEDKMKLTAEVNGQVIFAEDRLSVETVYRISGDVSMRTGNVTFLGSIVITGNIEDNFQVKASGNIEIYGTVQKAQVEADGDIIIRQGVTGRGEARIESTGGNVVSKFLQDAIVITDKDVIVQEAIMNCDVSAGGKVVCNGKKANILGGRIKAGLLISAKNIGSPANPTTELIVGVNPKYLKQVEDYTFKKKEAMDKLEILYKSHKTLLARQESDPASFTEENVIYLGKLEVGVKKLEKRIAEYDKEIQLVNSYMEQVGDQGKVYFEKKMYGGVSVRIKNAEPYKIKNELQAKTLFLSEGKIQMKAYADPDNEKGETRRSGRRK
ncbi:MAG: FapA family protein [Leptospiraceae bacterium]|nr:FapA family protein [Leptospiraceae bacterium]